MHFTSIHTWTWSVSICYSFNHSCLYTHIYTEKKNALPLTSSLRWMYCFAIRIEFIYISMKDNRICLSFWMNQLVQSRLRNNGLFVRIEFLWNQIYRIYFLTCSIWLRWKDSWTKQMNISYIYIYWQKKTHRYKTSRNLNDKNCLQYFWHVVDNYQAWTYISLIKYKHLDEIVKRLNNEQ